MGEEGKATMGSDYGPDFLACDPNSYFKWCTIEFDSSGFVSDGCAVFWNEYGNMETARAETRFSVNCIPHDDLDDQRHYVGFQIDLRYEDEMDSFVRSDYFFTDTVDHPPRPVEWGQGRGGIGIVRLDRNFGKYTVDSVDGADGFLDEMLFAHEGSVMPGIFVEGEEEEGVPLHEDMKQLVDEVRAIAIEMGNEWLVEEIESPDFGWTYLDRDDIPSGCKELFSLEE